jgi:cytochrome oxidase Cu insertion factor (SCO1/SenC/PrrC family)
VTDSAAELAPTRSWLRPRVVATVLVVAVAVGAAGGALARVVRTHRAPAVRAAVPAYNGQAVWRAGSRPAPGFTLRDQNGAAVSLASVRGRPVLLTFLDSQCRSSCPLVGRQLGSILRALPPPSRPVVLVVSVDHAGDTPAGIDKALTRWRLRGPWTVHWLNASSRAALATVWRAYGIRVLPTTNDVVHSLTLYLIDRNGFERTAYLFPFLPGFVQHDLARLARSTA